MEEETIVLAVPKPENMPRYRFHEMLKFCEATGKDIQELTKEEKAHFEIGDF